MTEIDETKQKKLYKELYRRLVSLARSAGVNEEKLQDYFTPKNKSLLKQLAISLQNSGRMQNSIKYDTNKEKIQTVLNNFTGTTWKDLYNEMIEHGIHDNGKKNKETNWEKYCKGLYDGLQFLNSNNNTIQNLIDEKPDQINKELLKKVSNITKNIHGLGFALTCDWLKECGCTWLAKPDAHITAVVKYMTGKKEEEKIKEEDICEYIFNWAKAVPVSAYQLDKIIWLLCTGNFYLHDVKIGRNAVCKTIDEVLEIKYPTCFI